MKYDYNYIKNYSLFDGLSENEISEFIKLMEFKTSKEKDIWKIELNLQYPVLKILK